MSAIQPDTGVAAQETAAAEECALKAPIIVLIGPVGGRGTMIFNHQM